MLVLDSILVNANRMSGPTLRFARDQRGINLITEHQVGGGRLSPDAFIAWLKTALLAATADEKWWIIATCRNRGEVEAALKIIRPWFHKQRGSERINGPAVADWADLLLNAI